MKTHIKEKKYNQIMEILADCSNEDKSKCLSYAYNQYRDRNNLRQSKSIVENKTEEKPKQVMTKKALGLDKPKVEVAAKKEIANKIKQKEKKKMQVQVEKGSEESDDDEEDEED